jgi:hypothetical protein
MLHHPPMERRHRRSTDHRTALHLFLESQLLAVGARSLRVTTRSGRILAGVGDDAYADGWRASWSCPVEGTALTIASSGGRRTGDLASGVRRITDLSHPARR